MKLITWEWTFPIGDPPTVWLTLTLNTRRGSRQIMRFKHTQGEDDWQMLTPKDWPEQVLARADLQSAMAVFRDLVGELLAEEFAGVG
jgi:hypothetical protein